MIKCDDFETNIGNSDTECSNNPYNPSAILSKLKLLEDISMCNRCPYNKKFRNWDWDKWKTYKAEVIIPELRVININKILD